MSYKQKDFTTRATLWYQLLVLRNVSQVRLFQNERQEKFRLIDILCRYTCHNPTYSAMKPGDQSIFKDQNSGPNSVESQTCRQKQTRISRTHDAGLGSAGQKHLKVCFEDENYYKKVLNFFKYNDRNISMQTNAPTNLKLFFKKLTLKLLTRKSFSKISS